MPSRSAVRALAALVLVGSASASRHALAQSVQIGPPSAALPPSPGTGLDTVWGTDRDAALFTSLDDALVVLNGPSTTPLDGVLVSFSNFVKPLGDFASHIAMPYSPQGSPVADGQYMGARMTGMWAARSAGTFTFAVGCDDGYRVILEGATLLNEPSPSAFVRAAATFAVPAPGLYPIEIDYFNGIQEGAIELSFTPGAVGLTSPYVSVPSAFALVPVTDLYPSQSDDAGVRATSNDAGVIVTSNTDAASPVEAGEREDAAADASTDAAPLPPFSGPDASGSGGNEAGPSEEAGPSDAATGGDGGENPNGRSDAGNVAAEPGSPGDAAVATGGETGALDDAAPSDDGAVAYLLADDGGDLLWRGGGCTVSEAPLPPLLFLVAPALIVGAWLRRRRRSASGRSA